MKKISTVLLMALLPLVNAQVTYTSADYANPLDQINYLTGNIATSINFAVTGSNFNWDFNSLQQSSTKQINLIDANNTGYKDGWCQKLGLTSTCNEEFNNKMNMAEKLMDNPIAMGANVTLQDIFSHSLKTSSSLTTKMIGIKILSNGLTIPVIMDYQLPDVLYKFPMNYNDSYTEPFSINVDLTQIGIDFKINTLGNRINHVDGWGDLTIDNKTYNNVLRLKTISDQNITKTQNGVSEQQSLKTINYQWFSKGYKLPILDVKGIENNGQFIVLEIVYLKKEAVLAVSNNQQKSLSIYPNPSDGNFKTNIPSKDIQSIEVYNVLGQLVSKSLDITRLPKGNYIIKINTATQSYHQKVVKN